MTKIKSIEEWRADIDLVDAELVTLLNRRVQLAVEMLALLRSKILTLGDAERDGDRLTIMLSREPALIPEPLDKRAVFEIYRRITWESRRLAERAVSLASQAEDVE